MVLFHSDKINQINNQEILNMLQLFDLHPESPFVIMLENKNGEIEIRKLNCDTTDLKLFAMTLIEDSLLHAVAMNDDYIEDIKSQNEEDADSLNDGDIENE